jgi:hypothetical protein
LNRLYLAILQAVFHQTKEPEISLAEIWRIMWMPNSGKPPVLNFGHYLLAIVKSRIVHVEENSAT